jgi:hypothetical protein
MELLQVQVLVLVVQIQYVVHVQHMQIIVIGVILDYLHTLQVIVIAPIVLVSNAL